MKNRIQRKRKRPMRFPSFIPWVFLAIFAGVSVSSAATLTGRVIDEVTKNPIAARVYVHNSKGKYFHVQCENRSAIPYNRRRSEQSFEIHTTVPAVPFHADLPPGDYTVTVEKGKEYFPVTRPLNITDTAESIQIPMKRWTNMADNGWYSGETHVHREVSELPILQIAEDLNVAFPLTAWVTDSLETPATHNKNRSPVPPPTLVRVDQSHVFWPVNTEYEIFSVRGRQHTLGAVFILNHNQHFSLPAPPVGPIAEEARRQGAFLELDKHNWPWSMMLIPQMKVELYELANNHMWRTEFLYADWYPEYADAYMKIEKLPDGRFTERGWIDFGFENYYALLNCGFKMQPTAGTASGVHPVPFGFGRVYVQVDGDFSYDKWVQGLLAGRSFVTTGPMLTTSVKRQTHAVRVAGLLESATKPVSLEVLVNGKVARQITTPPRRSEAGAFEIPFAIELPLSSTSWVAVRAFAQRDGDRVSFAHSAPVHFEIAGKPLRPPRRQRDYLVKRVRDEMARSRGVISKAALREFEDALAQFSALDVAD